MEYLFMMPVGHFNTWNDVEMVTVHTLTLCRHSCSDTSCERCWRVFHKRKSRKIFTL